MEAPYPYHNGLLRLIRGGKADGWEVGVERLNSEGQAGPRNRLEGVARPPPERNIGRPAYRDMEKLPVNNETAKIIQDIVRATIGIVQTAWAREPPPADGGQPGSSSDGRRPRLPPKVIDLAPEQPTRPRRRRTTRRVETRSSGELEGDWQAQERGIIKARKKHDIVDLEDNEEEEQINHEADRLGQRKTGQSGHQAESGTGRSDSGHPEGDKDRGGRCHWERSKRERDGEQHRRQQGAGQGESDIHWERGPKERQVQKEDERQEGGKKEQVKAKESSSRARTYHDILGVPQHAQPAEIKKAYQQQLLVRHPDKASLGGSREKYDELQEVYGTLGDAGKRAQYDASLVAEEIRRQAACSKEGSSEEEVAVTGGPTADPRVAKGKPGNGFVEEEDAGGPTAHPRVATGVSGGVDGGSGDPTVNPRVAMGMPEGSRRTRRVRSSTATHPQGGNESAW